ncbi:hypothetical protein [Massilia pseudoviolaceinigra]|uniref:hypothetical protein n=1 Tax=Massilia pseudoviolaceinigra TaxID=3057165 RepID=UPI002796CB9D|nr:hypothetical protein [Massilia sp. CCM 9206]MDQ1922014.1 hypothetical protein [Massilia sp. CCM 9206]
MPSRIAPTTLPFGLSEPGSPAPDNAQFTRTTENASAELLLQLASGEWLGDAAMASDETRATLQELAAVLRSAGPGEGEPLRVGDALVALRRLPFLSTRMEGGAPAWSAGMAAAERIGPVTDQLGRPFWLDLFRPVRQLRFVRSRGGPPVLSLPIIQAPWAISGAALRAGQALELGAGSVWFATSLVAVAPPNVYSGVRIARGSLRFSVDLALGDDEVLLPPGVAFDLALDFDVSGAAAPAPGSVLAATGRRSPDGLVIGLGPAGATVSVVGDAGLGLGATTLTLAPAAGAARYRADLNRLVVPMTPDRPSITINAIASTLFAPSGAAPIAAAGLALPAAVIDPANLGQASGAGALMLELERGLSATWHGEPRPVELGPVLILLDETRLAVSGQAARATGRALRPPLAPLSAPATLAYARIDRSAVHFVTGADGLASVTLTARVDVRLPKPVDVAGNRVGMTLPAAQVVIATTLAGQRSLSVSGLALAPQQQRAIAFALTNAVMRATRPRAFFMMGRLEGERIVEALALTAYGMGGLLPSLPDPYAANTPLGTPFAAAGGQGFLLSQFRFGPGGETLSFVLPQSVAVAPPLAGPGFANVAVPPTLSAAVNVNYGDLFDFEAQGKVVLLDVSSNASRFGVAVRPPRRENQDTFGGAPLKPVTVQGLDLSLDGRMLVLLTLPAVQWEPVRNVPGPEPFPDEVRFANSGVPTTIDVPSVELVRINPLAAYDTILDNFAQDNPRPSRARFTLPFGIVAQARLNQASPAQRGARVGEVRPAFTDLQGAHQLRIAAVDPALGPGATPALPGFIAQLSVARPVGGGPLQSILGTSTTGIVHDYLGLGQPTALVPVTHIDLSGHGESLFSAWAHPDEPETGVAAAEFQVLNGRAAHEVIHVKSILLPYFVPVVRIITLERKGNAVVTREDSGWVAVGEGRYRAAPGSGIVVHPGVVRRATRVTNIRETGSTVHAGGMEFVAVYFNTDLIVDGADGPVPARRQLGYVKLSNPPLTAAVYEALIATAGPMGGALDASIQVAGGRQRMRLHRVGVGIAAPEFAMAAWGGLAFPAGGDWSVLEAANAVDAPGAVAAERGLPLIRQGAAGAASAVPFPYRFADPEDLLNEAAPRRDYGLLHSMGTQRAFFRRPRIDTGAPHRIVSSQRPVIADPLILATSTGAFPRQADAIAFPDATYALEARADGSWVLDAPPSFPAGVARRTIRSAGTVRSDLDYSSATVTYTLDTADPVPWRFMLEDAVKIMAHTAMGDLMSMAVDIDAEAGRATRFADPALRIGGPFDIVQDLLTILKDLGIPVQPDVRMTNDWSLSVALNVPFVDASGEDFQVPPGDPLPTIKFADTGVTVEVAVAPTDDEASLTLHGSPMFAIKSVPGLYVVAIIEFELTLSTEHGTTYGFLIGVGIAYSLEAGPFELEGLFAITFFAVFGDTVLGYGVGFLVKLSAELPPIVAIDLSLEGKLARLVAHKGLPDETVFQIAKLVFAIEVSIFLVFSISLEVETRKVEVIRGPLLESDAPDVI